jgi:hypothetical protein
MIDIDKFIKDHIGLINGTETTSASSEFPQDWVGVGEGDVRARLLESERNQEKERIAELDRAMKFRQLTIEFPYTCPNHHRSKRGDICSICGFTPSHFEIGKIIEGMTDITYSDEESEMQMDESLHEIWDQLPHRVKITAQITGEVLRHNEPNSRFVVRMDYYDPIAKMLSIEDVEDV